MAEILVCAGGGAVPKARRAIGNRIAKHPVKAEGGITDGVKADALLAAKIDLVSQGSRGLPGDTQSPRVASGETDNSA